MNIPTSLNTFILHFGEMGSRWGFNRTVGQMYALLVISETPLSASQIAETLNISRGNVSMGIKELQSWRLVQQHHIAGDRKDYYQALGSIWEMANRVMVERRKREVEPTLSLLRDVLLEDPSSDHEKYAQARLTEIHDLLEAFTLWSEELQKLRSEQLKSLMKLGSGVVKALEVKDKLLSKR